MPRLFVATYLDSGGVQRVQQLGRANPSLGEKWNLRARWVTADKLHLTWLFLGDVEEELVGEVAAALGAAVGDCASNGDPCGSTSNPTISSTRNPSGGVPSVSYEHFELWPSPRKARLGVIAPSMVPNEIAELARSISKNLSTFLTADQQESNKRPFKPHLTVLRFNPESRRGGGHSGKPRASIEDVIVPSNTFPIHQLIDRVELIESDMGKRVQGYVTRASFPV